MVNKKIKAFTILEVTIAMLIASVLIGFTYMAYSIVARSYSSFSQKNQDMAVLAQLDEWLKKDFARAEIVQKDTVGVTLNGANHHVKYQFDSDYILRIEIRTDTFKLKTDSIVTAFEGLPINEVSANEEENRLDDMQLVILFQNEKIPYHYHKQYSSANLINRNANAVN